MGSVSLTPLLLPPPPIFLHTDGQIIHLIYTKNEFESVFHKF